MRARRFSHLALLFVAFLVTALAVPRFSSAQEMSEQDKKMMEMMMKYGTPGKNHELLKKYAGDWDVEMKMWQSPGAEPMVSKGTQKGELILGGRYVKCTYEATMMGMTYHGLEIIGYDLFQNKYITLWIDNMGTGFFLLTGTLDASGKVLTDKGEYPDPMTDGKTVQKIKNVTTYLADGKYRFEMFMVGPDGKEFKSMELVSTRKM